MFLGFGGLPVMVQTEVKERLSWPKPSLSAVGQWPFLPRGILWAISCLPAPYLSLPDSKFQGVTILQADSAVHSFIHSCHTHFLSTCSVPRALLHTGTRKTVEAAQDVCNICLSAAWSLEEMDIKQIITQIITFCDCGKYWSLKCPNFLLVPLSRKDFDIVIEPWRKGRTKAAG